jgi:hypothetical protein
VPDLGDELLGAWADAHGRAAAAVDDLGLVLGHTLRRWYVGHLVVALAGRSPTLSGLEQPLLVPAPRGFFSEQDHARLAGTAAAFCHVDVRIMLVRDGFEPAALRPETPFVLHALAESGKTGRDETNPGLFRTRVAGWLETVSPYVHPPAELVRPIITELIGHAATSTDPPPALAGWAAFTWMSVHPWVDGNGRTARLLYLLLTGPHLALDLDYGIVEQFTFRRRDYVAALQAGQHVTPVYDPDVLDACPFTTAATEWSIAGAQLMTQRARLLGIADGHLAGVRPDLDDAQRALALWVGLERLGPASAFASALGRDDAVMHAPVDELEDLCGRGVLTRRALPPSRQPLGRRGAGGGPIGYAPGDDVHAALSEAVRTVASGG